MVGSLYELRVTPASVPIGTSTKGLANPRAPAEKPVAGKSTPQAQWKQSDDYRQLTATRAEKVSTLKALGPAAPAVAELVVELRSVEQKLRDLRPSRAGDH